MSSWGNTVKISIFGESHGTAIGCVLEGLPAGESVDLKEVQQQMARRAPGRDSASTPRREADVPHVLSGLLNGIITVISDAGSFERFLRSSRRVCFLMNVHAALAATMIRELKTLIAVAGAGTFAGAGQTIGLTQAAVSAQMQRLEEALGFALFDRSGRTARLNPRGHEILARARELVRLHDELGGRGAAAKAIESVTVGAIASIQRARLPDALARFHRDNPNARSRVVPGVSKDLLDLVDAGELDLALVIRPPFALQRELRWADLAREPFRLLVPAPRGRHSRADGGGDAGDAGREMAEAGPGWAAIETARAPRLDESVAAARRLWQGMNHA